MTETRQDYLFSVLESLRTLEGEYLLDTEKKKAKLNDMFLTMLLSVREGDMAIVFKALLVSSTFNLFITCL